MIENVLTNNIYLVRKIITYKTLELHRMQLPQFTHRKHFPNIQTMLQEGKFDPEVSIEHDDLYARAWQCNYERPIFDAGYNNAAPPTLPEIAVRSDLPTEEMWNTPGTSRERSPDFSPKLMNYVT